MYYVSESKKDRDKISMQGSVKRLLRERSELKHLSKNRKIKQYAIS